MGFSLSLRVNHDRLRDNCAISVEYSIQLPGR